MSVYILYKIFLLSVRCEVLTLSSRALMSSHTDCSLLCIYFLISFSSWRFLVKLWLLSLIFPQEYQFCFLTRSCLTFLKHFSNVTTNICSKHFLSDYWFSGISFGWMNPLIKTVFIPRTWNVHTAILNPPIFKHQNIPD